MGIVSLGCPKNLVDSEIMAGRLSSPPFYLTPSLREAEIIIVNTCAFLSTARRESITLIKKLAAYKERNCRLLIAAGCLVQYLGADERRFLTGVDLFLGVGEYSRLPDILLRLKTPPPSPVLIRHDSPAYHFRQRFPRRLSTPGHYAYLRIADGCDNRCRYCLIPSLRGPYRSRPLSPVLEEARQLVEGGVKELVVVAQDTSYYGREKGGKPKLELLLKELVKIPGLRWIRILYCHPDHLPAGVLRIMAESSMICSYLDLPLQHINDRVLKRMGRRSGRREIEELLERAREIVPDLSLRTTFLVGFPGEGVSEFAELMEFVKRQRFDHLGVFAYSPEAGTAAFGEEDRVTRRTARVRRDRLMALQQKISRARGRGEVGKIHQVLLDGPFPEENSSLMVGHTRYQAPEIDGLVVVEGENLSPGKIIKVEITSSSEYDLYGRKIS